MNWIALIGAGLCEVAFTFCMGRLKGVSGWEFYSWLLGFLLHVTQHVFTNQGYTNDSNRNRLPDMDWYRSGRDGLVGHSFLS